MKQNVKRLLLVCFGCMIAVSILAQTQNKKIDFKAQESGVFKTDSDEGCYIIPFEGKTAHELYNETLVHIAKLFVSFEEVTSTIEDRIIIINSEVNEFIEATTEGVTGGSIREWFDFSFKIEIEFKDGKMRVNAPDIVGGRIRLGSRTLDHAVSFPGKLILQRLFEDKPSDVILLEDYLNVLIGDMIYGEPGDNDW